MARTLVLVRHAQTERTHPGGDHGRELVPAGVADAQALGSWLAAEDLLADLVLASTATRARQTTEHVLAGASEEDAELWTSRRLYDHGPQGALEAIHEAPDEAATVWVIGHEPTMSILVRALADEAASGTDALGAVAEGMPTATAAVLRLEVPWADLGPGMARLETVRTARG